MIPAPSFSIRPRTASIFAAKASSRSSKRSGGVRSRRAQPKSTQEEITPAIFGFADFVMRA
jgi:hypothetical protein